MLRCAWTLKPLCKVGEARCKRPWITFFHLFKISRISQSTKTKSRLVITGPGAGKTWNDFWWYGFAFLWGDENVLESDDGDCRTLWTHWKAYRILLKGWISRCVDYTLIETKASADVNEGARYYCTAAFSEETPGGSREGGRRPESRWKTTAHHP